MKRAVLAAAFLFTAPRAFASGRVVVVEPESSADFAWPSGERAVVAELMASDVELVLRPSQAPTLQKLEQEVLEAAAEPDTAGAVGVGREGSRGVALVAPRAGRAPVRIEDDVQQGPVAEGAVALRVSEVLRVRHFELPPVPEKRPISAKPEEPQPSLWPWLSVAGVAAHGASGVAPALAMGLRVPLHSWLSLEPAGAFTLSGLNVETSAGDVKLSERQATLEVVVAPNARRGLSAGLGAGGGIAWFSAAPRAAEGYVGLESSTEVALVALRGFGAWQSRHLRVLAFLELSMMLPAVTVRAEGTELEQVGTPWAMGGLALGYGP
jgi:hypothetical protein